MNSGSTEPVMVASWAAAVFSRSEILTWQLIFSFGTHLHLGGPARLPASLKIFQKF